MDFQQTTSCRGELLFGNPDYKYNNKIIKYVSDMPLFLVRMLDTVRGLCNINFDVILVNKFFGDFVLNFHKDDEHELMPNCTIATVSVGDECEISFKNKFGVNSYSIVGGSLYLMEGCFQNHNYHSVQGKGLRYSFTFRVHKNNSKILINPWVNLQLGSEQLNREQVFTPKNIAEEMIDYEAFYTR